MPVSIVRDLEQNNLQMKCVHMSLSHQCSGNNSTLPVPNGSRNFRVAAATIAQKKLRHITLGGKKYETSSSEKRTPPMGAPKATATPAETITFG